MGRNSDNSLRLLPLFLPGLLPLFLPICCNCSCPSVGTVPSCLLPLFLPVCCHCSCLSVATVPAHLLPLFLPVCCHCSCPSVATIPGNLLPLFLPLHCLNCSFDNLKPIHFSFFITADTHFSIMQFYDCPCLFV